MRGIQLKCTRGSRYFRRNPCGNPDLGDLVPLIDHAVQHPQFEALHRLSDGNGRTGRVLNLLYLIEHGLLDIAELYLSRSIIRRKSDYYRLLLDVTAKDAWEPWVLFMVEAVAETASWTSAKIRAIRDLLDQTVSTMREHAPRIYSRELAELIFSQPYCRIGNLVETGLAQRQSASACLRNTRRVASGCSSIRRCCGF